MLLFPQRGYVPSSMNYFAGERPSQQSNDAEPPPYSQICPVGVDFEHPPSYFHAINEMGVAGYQFRTVPRTFRSTADVQLTPTDGALLRDGWMLNIFVELECPAREVEKAKISVGSFCLRCLRYAVLRKVRVKKENVDDYGKWTGPEPR